MKHLFIFTITIVLLFSCNNVQRRNNNTQDSNNVKEQHIDNMQENDVQEQNIDTATIVMLHDLYTAYANFLSKGISFKSQFDSLFVICCTDEFRLAAQEVFYDLLTDGLPIDTDLLKSMKIIKDATKNDCYIVSYTIDYVSDEQPVTYDVTLYVDVVKVGERYKISGVESENYFSADDYDE